MKKFIFTLSIIFCIGGCFRSVAQISNATSQRLDMVFDSLCLKYTLKGASAAILVPNTGTWTRAYGESYAGAPIRKDMLMGIGSNTKTFVASLMLKLQEMKKLSLDDTIGKWVINKKNIRGQITIRQLLNHTSGIFSFTEHPHFFDSVNADPFRIWQKEELYGFVNAQYFTPGKGWRYSNTNYVLAGIIIEKVMNKPIETLLQEMIFTPQGLTNTFYFPQQAPSLEIAHQWSKSINNTSLIDLATIGWSNNAMFSMASSAGAIMQTAEDNAKFWDKLLSSKIINQSSLNEMMTYADIGGGDGYGLGIFRYTKNVGINDRTFYSHGGTNIGFINENMVDSTSRICFSILTNQDDISNDDLLAVFISALQKVTIDMSTGIENIVYNERAIRVYPNPATNELYVDMEHLTRKMFINFYDISGKLVLSEEAFGNKTHISTELLGGGFYYFKLTSPEGLLITTQKIQIIR